MIFTKQTREANNGTEFQVRLLGQNFWISEDEFTTEVAKGSVFFKANKPVTLKDII